jgi:hypothetical protein
MSYFSGFMTIVGGFFALAAKAATPEGIFGITYGFSFYLLYQREP